MQRFGNDPIYILKARDTFITVVPRRGAEESNLQAGTFRSLALLHLESINHSGGVGEAGRG